MPYGDSMSYLPAMSRLMGEVEQPTQAGAMTSPQFGGSPEQLMQMMQSPHMQQMLQQWGINFDPSQMRQSPFLPNSFMHAHPQLGGAMSGAMANVAATPEAPLVSGAGSGMTRAMQGMAGGPEMQRQYQIRQMLAPMQMIGQQMPVQEFGRKQQLLDLLTKMEQDRAQSAQRGQDLRAQQPVRTPYGMIQPGAMTDPSMAGQSPNQLGMGTNPLFNLFQGQGQQPLPAQQPPTFQPFDPNMIKQQTDAAHPERGAQAGLAGARAEDIKAQSPAKVDELKARADKERGQGQQARAAAGEKLQKIKGEDPGAFAKFSKQYNDAQQQHAKIVQRAQELMAAGQIDQKGHDSMVQAADNDLATAKANIDQARGKPGESALGAMKPGAPQANAQPRPGGGQAGRPGATGGPQGQPSAPAQQQQPLDPTNPAYWANPQ